ncbi:MAG TPA: hypothetical protein VNZ45_13045 [Bacteroidia bacterium]|jgi:hypothetical protein|nr:hypothetical protein [Bacteroidia bacterium]
MKLLYGIALFLIGSLVFSSCAKKENLSIIPAITFKSMDAATLDSAIMEVNFTDGDGDIGYLGSASDAQPDFFIEYLRDSAGAFVPMLIINGPTPTVVQGTYKIPDVTPAGKNKSLTGIIRINMEQWTQGLPITGDTLQFNVWLLDRAGHKSNVLTTPSVIVP